jgi:uncharacterized CHY-type Zn-finger protein
MIIKVGETEIYGIDVDPQTRCAHWHSEVDIIAIKFKCCGKWFPCYECHADLSDHTSQVWGIDECDEKAVLCGNCGYFLSIDEYMNCENVCPECEHGFNAGCANHYHLYFNE